jgi:TolB-like protein/class 3 adenylate cyclase/Tfp pilus assembly protein PilF
MAETRKLAAILCSDVVGFSRLAGADEDRILARLRALRSDLIDPTIAVHNGRVVKRTGDGSIVEFRSAVDAIRCAIEVQNAMIERNAGVPEDRQIVFRIGIHVGDVVEESDGDLMGDGINIAARLEGIAKPGAICLSEDAYRQVSGRLDMEVTDLGATQLKNISRPIRAYSLQVGVPAQAKPAQPATPTAPAKGSALAPLVGAVVAALIVIAAGGWYVLVAKRSGPAATAGLSIVVLPFSNLSGDPTQDYFADVLTDQLTTYLSRIPGSFVIARNTAFTYKGKPTDVKQIGRDLGVRYALEGSVQPTGGRVRVNAQLIDAESDAHLWAETFDHDRADLLQMEDDIVTRLARTLQIQFADIEVAKVQHTSPTTNPDVRELTLRCQAVSLNFTYDNTAGAVFAPCEQALALDPSNVAALSALSLQASGRVSAANSSDRAADIARARELAARALAADSNSPDAHFAQGNALQVQKRFDEAKSEFERAIALNPSEMAAYGLLALAYFNTGEPEAAITLVEKALRLSPLDALRANWFGVAGLCSVTLHRDDQAVDWLRRSLAVSDKGPTVHIFLAGALGLIGNDAEARDELQRYLAMPEARVKTIAALKLQRNSNNPSYLATRERVYEGLRKAGMPEE